MNRLEAILTMLDYSLNTRRKRHLTGGILISASLLFGGLAITVFSLKLEDNETDNARNYLLDKEQEDE